MVLSKRERIILIVTAFAVGALLLDKVILGPVTKGLDELKVQRDVLVAEVGDAQRLFERRRVLEPRYKEMLADGFRNDTEAESRVLRSLRDWSQNADLTLSSVKPERVASDQGLREMTFAVAGTGSLRSVAQFLWQIETAALPIKVKSVQIGSASEAGDSMSLQLRLSALYLGEQSGPAAAVKPEVNDEDDF